MKVSTLLLRENNNLDIFRLIAALMVLWGHAYSLAPEGTKADYIQRHLHFGYSGSVAVNIFFFLSGLVVTNSLLENKDPYAFAVRRLFRIWPALIAVVLVSALVIGPAMTTLGLHQYFSNPDTWLYIKDNINLDSRWSLPGVFKDNAYPDAVNGSLWTLPWEVGAYIYVLWLFMIGSAKSKYIALAVSLFFLAEIILTDNTILGFLDPTGGINLALCSFIFGFIVAVFKNEINITGTAVVGFWIGYHFSKHTVIIPYFFFVALFLTIMWLSSTRAFLRIRLKSDISYGVYLWGFPVQQVLSHYFLPWGVFFNQMASIAMCSLIGWLSWQFLEKPSIRMGGALSRRVQKREGHLSAG